MNINFDTMKDLLENVPKEMDAAMRHLWKKDEPLDLGQLIKEKKVFFDENSTIVEKRFG